MDEHSPILSRITRDPAQITNALPFSFARSATTRSRHFLVVLSALAVLAIALPATTAYAQEMPSWAEPIAPPPDDRSLSAYDVDEGGGVPDPPTEPVPVDGGLALLVLAGGAYAVRRLRR